MACAECAAEGIALLLAGGFPETRTYFVRPRIKLRQAQSYRRAQRWAADFLRSGHTGVRTDGVPECRPLGDRGARRAGAYDGWLHTGHAKRLPPRGAR